MKKTLILAAAFCMLAALPVRASLLVKNGGFEATTDYWIFSDGASIVDDNPGHAAKLESTSSILQMVTPEATQEYILNFWAKTDGTELTHELWASVANNNYILSSTILSSTYKHYTYTFWLVADLEVPLNFFWRQLGGNSSSSVYIDDVNLIPVPEPTTMIAGALLLLPFGMSTIRILRKRHIA